MLMLAAVLDLAFAAFHLGFWRLFGWPARLKGPGNLNAAITQTLNVMLTFTFVSYGATLLWLWYRGLIWPPLLFFGAAFWAIRLAAQFALFDMRHWQSKLISTVFAVSASAHALAGL
ncbi:hypothetical protein [Mesorhizobium sp.]|uniref:hypothetical protein n=1 Tax=Mesorhizobium sp. TaxID=1871066 RepID=UPI0012267E6C|nr:hypothetical protein [Mesorhizobium sp.]TIN74435.1 MAG: hypothetical protein E5Y09_32805 [Mesorhizobium sp.]